MFDFVKLCLNLFDFVWLTQLCTNFVLVFLKFNSVYIVLEEVNKIIDFLKNFAKQYYESVNRGARVLSFKKCVSSNLKQVSNKGADSLRPRWDFFTLNPSFFDKILWNLGFRVLLDASKAAVTWNYGPRPVPPSIPRIINININDEKL